MLLERPVDPIENGRRIDAVLAEWLDEPRARTQRRLAAGEVQVDGRGVGKSHRLRAGERVVVQPPSAPPPPAPPPAVPVRFDDEHLAVVAKPAGLVVHPGAGVRDATLVDALVAAGMPLAPTRDPERPGVVHRLDRGTSGLLVVAKTAEAAAALSRLLHDHRVARTYLAIVDGVPASRAATVEAAIARSTGNRTRFAVDPGGRHAVTHYDVVRHGRAGGLPAAVLDVRLETGRTHQVRVHLAAIGHPVAGDTVYGASVALRDALALARPALHARRLVFEHPITGMPVDVTEPPPADLVAALERLRS